MIRLILKHKAEVIKEFHTRKKKISIGRSKKNDIVISDKKVSRRHCGIFRDGKGYFVKDLDSTLGTQFKGKKIDKKKIEFGEEIKIGEYSVKLAKRSPIRKQAYLLGVQGRADGKKYEVNFGETRIGRSEDFNDIWLSKDMDKSVSRRHATITFDGKKHILTDKRSRNRTFVNQRQVDESDEVHLKNGDEILIGKSVFRYLVGEKDNYSYPKKAGIFWVRKFPAFRALFFLAAVAAGVYGIYQGQSSISVLESQPSQYYLRESGWEAEGLRLVDGFLEEGDFDITPSPAIGDVTGNGANEVVAVSPEGEVYVWSARGNLIWKNKVGRSELTSPQLADVNRNNVLDVIVGSDDSRVRVFDGRTGQMIYRSPFLGGRVLFASSLLVEDLDGSGFSDIVAVTDDRVISFIYSPVVGVRSPYYFKTADDIMSSPVLFAVGGIRYVAVATNGGKIYIFEAEDPERRRVLDYTEKINRTEIGSDLVLNEINTVPVAADFNNDGNESLVPAAGSYFVGSIYTAGEELDWLHNISPYSELETPLRYGSPAVADLNGDGRLDIALGWTNGKVFALDGRSGRELWSFTHGEGEKNRIIASPALGDFTKDGAANPVVAYEDGSVIIVDGERGAIARVQLDNPITATPAVGDITGDGYIDVAVVSVDGSVNVLETPVRVFTNELFWPSFRSDSGNRGVMTVEYKREAFVRRIISGAGVILIVFISIIIIKIKRKRKRPEKVKI